MSAIDEPDEANMVCATVNAPHGAGSTTIRAYLAAHRPDRALAFKISVPSAEAGHWLEPVLGKAGVSLRSSADGCFVGTAAGQTWAELLVKQGERLDAQSISLSPLRPGGTSR